MARVKTVWGIDIGQCALKAIKLADFEEVVEVVDFEVIEHPEILSQPDVDKPLLIRQSLEQFLSAHETRGSTIVLSVPGQSSFTRFFKPPPVDAKELPRIVQYEAAQQIPFPVDEVIWRWQAFINEDSPDLEVGIFAMKRQDINEMLAHLEDVGLHADIVQVAPLSLYNFVTYDDQAATDGATLIADIGADKTDLVVVDGSSIWTRTIQIGGNNFTEALGRAFKLSFAKAEKLKRTAATSKYARQVFQAMRPVFADLVQEMQRSVGYYISLHRDSRFQRLVGLGNGFRLPGLQKFLEQNLNIPVARLDHFNNVSCAEHVNVPQFEETSLSFGVAYGLALQAIRPMRVETNLLPSEIARRRVWSKKTPWFVGAAVALILAIACPTVRAFLDSQAMPDMEKNPSVLREARRIKSKLENIQRRYKQLQGAGTTEHQRINDYKAMYGYHDFWPSVQSMVAQSLKSITGEAQGLLGGYITADDFAQRMAITAKLKDTPRAEREMVLVEGMASIYSSDLRRELTGGAAAAVDPNKPGVRGFIVMVTGRTPLPLEETIKRLESLRFNAEEMAKAFPSLSVLQCKVDHQAGAAPSEGAPNQPDPMFPDEDTATDTRFTVTWLITIDGDGLSDD